MTYTLAGAIDLSQLDHDFTSGYGGTCANRVESTTSKTTGSWKLPRRSVMRLLDANQFSTWDNGGTYDVRGDLNLDGDVDTTDYNTSNGNSGTRLGRGVLSDDPDTVGNRNGYAGYIFDDKFGFETFHVRNRWYNASLARWLTRDRLEYVDTPNLYGYIAGNPLNFGGNQIGASTFAGNGFVLPISGLGSFDGPGIQFGGSLCIPALTMPGVVFCFEITFRWWDYECRCGCGGYGIATLRETCISGGIYHIGSVPPLLSPTRPGRIIQFLDHAGSICPPNRCRGRVCVTFSVGAWFFTVGCRVCTDGSVTCGFNVGSGTGVSASGCYTCTTATC